MDFLQRYENYKKTASDRTAIFDMMDTLEIRHYENVPPKKIKKIVMLLPNIYPQSGGITSALRIISSFQRYNCKAVIALIGDMNPDLAKANAVKCIPSFNGSVKKIDDCLSEQYDICIATSWKTAYFAKKLSGYKVYFVQDYEPYFYETSDFSCLAKNTYELGFHIISLGKWNLEKIKSNSSNNIKGKLDYIDFPYSRSEYTFECRDYLSYKNKKEINIACYIRHSGRRIPYICEYILIKTKNKLERQGYKVSIKYFGMNKLFRFESGENLGILSRQELAKLYKISDFGMVASMSNISLVPYEMLASGLTVIEFREGSYPYFLGEDTALLIDFDYHTLCNKILDVLENPSKLITMHEKAEEKLARLSWDKTCNQFWNILQKTIV